MSSFLFWLLFLATFLALKTLADGWLALPIPARVPRRVAEKSSASEPEPTSDSLRPAA